MTIPKPRHSNLERPGACPANVWMHSRSTWDGHRVCQRPMNSQGVLMCDLAENIIRAPKVLKLLPRHKVTIQRREAWATGQTKDLRPKSLGWVDHRVRHTRAPWV